MHIHNIHEYTHVHKLTQNDPCLFTSRREFNGFGIVCNSLKNCNNVSLECACECVLFFKKLPFIHTCTGAYIHTCTQAYIHTMLAACAPSCLDVCTKFLLSYIRAHMRTCIYIYIRIYIYIQTYTHLNIHTFSYCCMATKIFPRLLHP